MNKAIFLDRDGTINEEVNFLCKKEDIKIIPRVKEALKILKDNGFINIIITNQSGIARGYLTEKDLEIIHYEIDTLLSSNGVKLIDDFFYSPFHIEGIIDRYKLKSKCTKPDIGMVLEAKKKYNIDFSKSYFIGDSLRDMQCAENAGIKKILVLTGYGNESLEKSKKIKLELDFVANDLYDAVQFICKNS